MKTCTKCGQEKPLKAFPTDKRRTGNAHWKSICVECERERQRLKQKRWREENYEEALARVRRYGNKNRDLWIEVYLIPKYGEHPTCQICGESLNWRSSINNLVHFDHRNGNKTKIKSPTNFFRRIPTEERIKQFEAEDFGILCGSCNKHLPTELSRRRSMATYILGGNDAS